MPLFLHTVSSDLIRNQPVNEQHYFVFAGICLIAALLSRIFLGDETHKLEERIRTLETVTIELNQAAQRLLEHPAAAETPESATGPDIPEIAASDPEGRDELSRDAQLIINSLKQPDYVFKSVGEIERDLQLSKNYLELLLKGLEETDFVIHIRRDNDQLWGLTYKGYNYQSN